MKKLFIFLFVLGISTQLFADVKAKNIVGKWKYTVESDQGEMTGVLEFVEVESKLIGKVITDQGETFPMTKVELKKGNILYFELKPEYDVIKVTVEVDGKKFSGTGSTYEGDFALVGEKQK